jgi:hypothetical protein
MTPRRVGVEWMFAIIAGAWPFAAYKSKQKLLGGSNVGVTYLLASFLSNLKCCVEGNEVSRYFGCDPPTLHEYINR